MRHTPEPWTSNNHLITNSGKGSSAILIAQVSVNTYRDESRHNTARIVECVNACAGIEDPQNYIQELEAKVAELQRDADRYRYLRNRTPNEVFYNDGLKAGLWIDRESKDNELLLVTGEDADKDIDAAIQGEK